MPIEKMYQVKEAAELLGLSVWTIQSYLSSGRLMRTKIGSRTLIRESQLLRLLRDGEKSAAPRREASRG